MYIKSMCKENDFVCSRRILNESRSDGSYTVDNSSLTNIFIPILFVNVTLKQNHLKFGNLSFYVSYTPRVCRNSGTGFPTTATYRIKSAL